MGIAMQNEGVLEVDKITGKAGNFVFMNAHSVGLSSKLSDFEGLAVSMRLYEQTLAGLTGGLSDKAHLARRPRCSCLLLSGLETKRRSSEIRNTQRRQRGSLEGSAPVHCKGVKAAVAVLAGQCK